VPIGIGFATEDSDFGRGWLPFTLEEFAVFDEVLKHGAACVDLAGPFEPLRRQPRIPNKGGRQDNSVQQYRPVSVITPVVLQ